MADYPTTLSSAAPGGRPARGGRPLRPSPPARRACRCAPARGRADRRRGAGAAGRGRDAALAGADLGADRDIRQDRPERRARAGGTCRALAAEGHALAGIADERSRIAFLAARAATPRRQRRRGRADRDPPHRRHLRGRQRHRHRRPGERPRHLPGHPLPGHRAARRRSPGTARPTWRPFRHIDSLRPADRSRSRCPTPTSPTRSSVTRVVAADERRRRRSPTSATAGSCCPPARRCSARPNGCSCTPA